MKLSRVGYQCSIFFTTKFIFVKNYKICKKNRKKNILNDENAK
jgi:hypothetical protein